MIIRFIKSKVFEEGIIAECNSDHMTEHTHVPGRPYLHKDKQKHGEVNF